VRRRTKTQIQALDREQAVLPMTPGVAEPRTHTYVRSGQEKAKGKAGQIAETLVRLDMF
jgi:hypothetical protein